MRPPSLPTLRAATQATFFQRAVALVAMALLISVVLFWPQIRDHAGEALAQAQDNNFEPFNCGQNNSTNPQQRRQSLNLYNNAGLGSYTSGKAYPCISGVAWRLVAGNTSATITGAQNNVLAEVAKIYTEGPQTLYFAGTSSIGNLVHLGFASLVFCDGTTATNNANYSNGMGCVRQANGIQLYADTNSSPSLTVRPLNNYILNIVPSGDITVGGQGVLGDLWATGNSVLQVPMGSLPLTTTGCGSLGVNGNSRGSGLNNTCDFTVDSLTGGLAQNLAAGGNFPITALNLTFYYLITHKQGSVNPYDGNELSNPSLKLPNTRIKVGDGS